MSIKCDVNSVNTICYGVLSMTDRFIEIEIHLGDFCIGVIFGMVLMILIGRVF